MNCPIPIWRLHIIVYYIIGYLGEGVIVPPISEIQSFITAKYTCTQTFPWDNNFLQKTIGVRFEVWYVMVNYQNLALFEMSNTGRFIFIPTGLRSWNNGCLQCTYINSNLGNEKLKEVRNVESWKTLWEEYTLLNKLRDENACLTLLPAFHWKHNNLLEL